MTREKQLPEPSHQRVGRRMFLSAVATGAAVSLAGCGGDGDSEGDEGNSKLPAPVLGNPDAGVTLAVFEDFACPHCAHYNANGFSELNTQYIEPGRIRYEHQDYPLPVADPGSYEAANAARAVQDQEGTDGFYRFSKRVFANHDQVRANDASLYKSIGDEMGLDGEAIRIAGTKQSYEPTVSADEERGMNLGIRSTPTFVINGEIAAEEWGSGTLGSVRNALDRRL